MRESEAFTKVEVAFFRAGDEMMWDDGEERQSTRAPTEPPVLEDEEDDDEWEWKIAIARARSQMN